MRFITFFAVALALAGCDRSDGARETASAAEVVSPGVATPGDGPMAPSVDDVEAPAAAPAHRYSPFAIRLDGHRYFDVVTFKDVSQTLPDPALMTDELMAEGFALALRRTHPAVMTDVVHEPALLDPGSHVFCDRRHLYVDFWQSPAAAADGPRWGYSLWSGCGEDDRFAWQEINGPAAYGLAEQVERVVDHIASRLGVADARACHQRRC